MDSCADKTYNVGGGFDHNVFLLELPVTVRALTGATIQIGSVPKTLTPDEPYYATDSSLVRTEIGWQPRRSFIETLADIHRWLVANRAVVASIAEGN